MIMPAHVPNIGIPAARARRSGSNQPSMAASRDIVVDSPPGITSASQTAMSSCCRTVRARAPARSNAETCSRTSP